VKRDILILNPPKCILLNTYLNKIFLRETFHEDFEENYLKELKEQLEEEELKELEKLKNKYGWKFQKMEKSVLNE